MTAYLALLIDRFALPNLDWFLISRPQWLSKTSRPTDLHPISDPGAGEGVPLQPLPDSPATHRNCSRALPHWAANQNLVPEPPDEAEEGAEGRQGAERAGEKEERRRSRWQQVPTPSTATPPASPNRVRYGSINDLDSNRTKVTFILNLIVNTIFHILNDCQPYRYP